MNKLLHPPPLVEVRAIPVDCAFFCLVNLIRAPDRGSTVSRISASQNRHSELLHAGLDEKTATTRAESQILHFLQ
jgi:hypothetical protein